MASYEGRLLADDQGNFELDGPVTVLWPDGYTSAQHGSRWVLRNQVGTIVATEGEWVELIGGWPRDDLFIACRATRGQP